MNYKRRREDIIADGCESSKLSHQDHLALKEELVSLEDKLDKNTRTTRAWVLFSILIGILAELLSSYYYIGG